VISVRGSLVALLGGWRGDRLFLSRGGGPFEPLADLGWDEPNQTTPQRRILLVDDACFVLEPEGEGAAKLDGTVRVRRFDLEGRETGREEGADEASDPWSADWCHFHAYRASGGPLRLWLRAIVPESGRAIAWHGPVEAGDLPLPHSCSGVPLRADDHLHLAIRESGLLVLGPEGGHLHRGAATTPTRIANRGVAAAGIVGGSGGVWIEGRWHPLAGPPPIGGARPPLVPLVAGCGEGGVALLRRHGGELGVIDGPPAKLPAGRYFGLVRLPEGLFAVAEGDSPRLVAAVL
jgi:hypothetical protein